MKTDLLQSRWHAFAAHLVFSFVVFLVLFWIIYTLWYPKFFVHLGGLHGIKLVAAIDFVLGPVLTLIVFNKAKKHLAFDLACVLAFQLGCLAYGLHAIYTQKPQLVVLSDEGLHAATHSEVKDAEIDVADLPATQTLARVPFYGLEQSASAEERNIGKATFELFGGTPFYLDSARYAPVEDNAAAIASRLASFPRHKEKDCWQVPLFSTHGQLTTCLRVSAEGKVEVIEADSST